MVVPINCGAPSPRTKGGKRGITNSHPDQSSEMPLNRPWSDSVPIGRGKGSSDLPRSRRSARVICPSGGGEALPDLDWWLMLGRHSERGDGPYAAWFPASERNLPLFSVTALVGGSVCWSHRVGIERPAGLRGVLGKRPQFG